MKIFKFKKVDAKTGISVDIEKPREGPTNPNLPGLEVVFDFGGFNYGTVDNTAEANPENYIFEIDQAELDQAIKDKTLQYLRDRKEEVYKQEKDLRQQLFGKYDDTATSSGIYKYNEAVKFLADGTPSLDITTEAEVRGVTETEIAERIVANHEAFRVKEAKIAGLRGKIYDRLDTFVFDDADAIGSWKELMERTEVIGQREPNEIGGVPGGDEENLDVVVGYYSPELNTRWQYLN